MFRKKFSMIFFSFQEHFKFIKLIVARKYFNIVSLNQ